MRADTTAIAPLPAYSRVLKIQSTAATWPAPDQMTPAGQPVPRWPMRLDCQWHRTLPVAACSGTYRRGGIGLLAGLG